MGLFQQLYHAISYITGDYQKVSRKSAAKTGTIPEAPCYRWKSERLVESQIQQHTLWLCQNSHGKIHHF